MLSSADGMMALAQRIAKASPGDAAALRRRPLDSPVYWSLPFASEHGPDCDEEDRSTVVMAVAILTPRGDVATKRGAYDQEVAFGQALARSGVPVGRVVRLLDSKRAERRKRLLGICRFLASRNKCPRFRLEQMANIVLSDDRAAKRLVLQAYVAPAINDHNHDEGSNQ